MPMSALPEELNVKFVDIDTRPTGLGEIGNPFIAGAISNAFYRLTGQRLRHLPFPPERALETLKASDAPAATSFSNDTIQTKRPPDRRGDVCFAVGVEAIARPPQRTLVA